MRKDIREHRYEIRHWIQVGRSKAWICKQLNCKQVTLNGWIARLGLPKYEGNKGAKGFKKSPYKMTAKEYASQNHVNSHRLRIKLLEDGEKNYQCEKCRRKTWNKQSIPLELHHRDGDHYNNDFDNLEILCPNCHAQAGVSELR